MVGVGLQIWIAFTGLVAVWLTQQPYRPEWARYACLFGLVGQPAWWMSTWIAEQWGIFVLTIFYTYAWWLGVKRHWLPKLLSAGG